MQVYIYLMCYNEHAILERTVKHYRRMLIDPVITVVDNMSTDGSKELARDTLGCRVVQWQRGDYLNEAVLTEIKNQEWKESRNLADWVIMCDMDEWLDVTKDDLKREAAKGSTILRTKGFEVVAASTTIDASDLKDMASLSSGYPRADMNKAVCFVPSAIERMNYTFGAHSCNPVGRVAWSNSTYRLRHMNTLGLAYFTHKHTVRYARAIHMRPLGLAIHYLNDATAVKEAYDTAVRLAEEAGCAVAVVDNTEVN